MPSLTEKTPGGAGRWWVDVASVASAAQLHRGPIERGEAGSLFLTRLRLADHMADGATVQRRANAVFAAMLEGTLTVAIEGHYTLETLQQVHERIEARQQIGKAVVWVDRDLH